MPIDEKSTPESAARIHARELSTAAVMGVSWTAVSVGVAKSSSFIAQLILGWLLSADDFGLYALAISSAAMVQGWTDGGAAKILVQRGSEYHKVFPPVLRIMLIFNFLATSVLLAGAPFAAQWFSAPELPLLIVIVAISIPLSIPVVLLRAKITSDLQFKTISKVDSVAAVLRQLLTVMFALLGFGPLSFVLPIPLVQVYEGVAFSRHTKLWPQWKMSARSPRMRDIWKDARWIMIASFAAALAYRGGPYFVIGLMEQHSILGVYFFASHLSGSFYQLLLPSMSAVMLGTFAKLSGQPQLQARGYLKAVRVLSLIVVAASGAMIVMAHTLISLMWSGKWNAAIPVVQILLLNLPARLLTLLSMPLIEARGQWRLRAMLLYERVITVMLCAGIGAWMGGLVSIALWVSGCQIVFSLVQCVVTGRLVGLAPREIITAAGAPVAVGLASALVSYCAVELLLPTATSLFQSIVCLFVFLFSYWVLTWGILGSRYSETLSTLKLMLKTRRPQGAKTF